MRANTIKIYLDDDELDRIEAMADAAHMPVSGYVRAYMMAQKPPKAKASGVTVEAVAALNRCGALLNQIAKIGNTTKTFSAAERRGVTAARERLLEIATDLKGDPT